VSAIWLSGLALGVAKLEARRNFERHLKRVIHTQTWTTWRCYFGDDAHRHDLIEAAAQLDTWAHVLAQGGMVDRARRVGDLTRRLLKRERQPTE
jgi:hypothetical protein